jgi:hypothetical protein
MCGQFVISLDFELHWGATEKWDIVDNIEYFKNARKSVICILRLFEQYNIHATWATVGYLFAKNKKQLLTFCPDNKPTYENKSLSSYPLIENRQIGRDEVEDPFHYAPSLIKEIIKTPNQELASHTFSHFYCNEKGQTQDQFKADIQAAQAIAECNFNIRLKSLVLPRNQFNPEYLNVVKENNINTVRSNPQVWFWNSHAKWTQFARAFDTLLPISKTLTYELPHKCNKKPLLLPASRFLRPYIRREKLIQSLKIKRIKNEMTNAAFREKCYHLWWHPHNFGKFTKENLVALEGLLKHYQRLHMKFDFQSSNMNEIYNL